MKKSKLKLGDIGEYSLIERLLNLLKKKQFPRLPGSLSVELGPGDDCAVIGVQGTDRVILVSTDTMAEGTHFRLDWLKCLDSRKFFRWLGYKSIAANISDISAMGNARPRFCLVNIGLPGSINLADIEGLYSGMNGLLSKCGILLIGGDTYRSEKINIAVTIIGEGKKEAFIKRSGARKGDYVYVTGTLGDSIAGLAVLEKRGKCGEDERYLVQKHFLVPVRTRESALIAKYATSMIDCSDGLYWSMDILSRESKASMRIDMEKIPLSPHLRRWAERNKQDACSCAVAGGEDYELIFTSGENNLDKKLNIGLRKIGCVLPGKEGVRYYFNNREIIINQKKLFSHF